MKHYLIDSENVGDFWIPLLELPAEEAELIVFYTKNSPHMSYDSLIKLKESDRKVTFIKCYEGTNALDFQLCSELGFLIASNEGDDFIIVTNDTGYDAAVKYWRRKEYSVKRIAGKDSRTGSRRRGNPVRLDVAAEVSSILNKLVQIPDQDEIGPDGSGQENAFETEASSPEYEEYSPAELEYEEDEEPAEEPGTDNEPDEEFAEEDTDAEFEEPFDDQDQAEDAEGFTDDAEEDSEEGYPMSEEEEAPVEASLGEDEGTEEESDSEDTAEETDGAESADVESADDFEEKSGEAEEETPEPGEEFEDEKKPDFVPDPEEIMAIVNCIGMENLAELHNQLIQFYGENGKDIYLSLKSGTLTIEKQDWDREDKFLYYCALILRHSDEPEEALLEENIRELADFLLGAESKRKNLNSLRYALLKHYGKEKGRRYYFMLKPYVKALNQM